MKTFYLTVCLILLTATSAYAQQPTQTTQDQLVAVYSNIANTYAKQIDAMNTQAADLRQQIAKLTAELKAAKDKNEPEKK